MSMTSLAIALKDIAQTGIEIQDQEDIFNIIPILLPWLSPPLHVQQISGGITNKLFKVSSAKNENGSVVLRIFGAEDVFTHDQREQENSLFYQLSQAGIAPGLHAVFGNGRVEQYYDARPITLDEMTTDVVGNGVAKAMARMHSFRPTGISLQLRVWQELDAWSKQALKLSEKSLLKTHFNVQRALEWIHAVRERLAGQNSPVVCAHNDLNCGNILLSTRDEVRFVDFEYSSFNNRGFDIANFFSECMGGTIDGRVYPDKYPSLDFRLQFCDTYLRETGETATEEEVRTLLQESERFELLTHLYWGFWGLVQSKSSNVDFPYILFAESRFAEFLKRFNCSEVDASK
eukprot:gb/GEZJ01000905.1/.p1 GENE.gb/GEZJ01000905.1/~~gb/GEZJ01000905.1/.p1  ORF type:complete len:346 (+),score=54.12 gb/GEZJ01000905.1/:948-1985(+)